MLILTKLQRPSVAEDFLVRSRLTERLEQSRSRKLTLISAPAGYGKSSLVSAWLESTADASVWLSIDKNDTDLTLFLSYLVTGIRAYFPEGCPSSFEILQAAKPPPFDVVAASLINDLAELATPLIIVFDDYQYIVGSDSARLITTLVQYAPHQINVVIVTRHDPNMALARLRAKHEMLEVRRDDLRFTQSEVAAFLATYLDRPLTEKTIRLFSEKTEGWAVGLRLAALSLRSSKDSAEFVEHFDSAQLESVLEYLMSEVFSHTTPALREFLLKTSICNRFSPQLCDELLEFSDPAIDAESIIDSLVRANLFIISIDDSHQWWRFHHLFQDLLQNQVQKRYTTQEINELHKRVSDWFANNGLLDEAIQHALAADDIVGAAWLIEQNRQAVINMDSWRSVERWLAELPDAIKGQRPELLLAQAWVAYYRDALWAIPPLLDSAEALLEDDGTIGPLQGEMAFFRSIPLFWQGESAGGLELLSLAIDRIPETNHQARGEAELYYGMVSQMAGQQEIAVKTFDRLLYGEQAPADIRKTRLLAALIFIYYLAGDLTAALQRTEQFQATAERVGSDYAVAWAHYMRGYVHFFRHELEEADRYFALAVQRRYILHSRVAVDSLVGQALTRQALGEVDAANASMAILLEFAQESNDLRNITSAVHASPALRSCKKIRRLASDGCKWLTWIPMPASCYIGWRFLV